MRHLLISTLLIAIMVAVAACRPVTREAANPAPPNPSATQTAAPPATATPTPAPVDEELVAFGRATYLKYYCGVCHTLPAAGTAGVFAPSHEHVGALAQERISAPGYTGAATTPAEYLRESIVQPAAYIAPATATSRMAMPPFGHLPPEEIDALVYFLLQQQ